MFLEQDIFKCSFMYSFIRDKKPTGIYMHLLLRDFCMRRIRSLLVKSSTVRGNWATSHYKMTLPTIVPKCSIIQ